MSRPDQDIHRLRAIAGMLRDARLADLRQARSRTIDLRDRITTLDTAAGTAVSGAMLFPVPSYLAWVQQSRAALNLQLAKALAAEDRAREAAQAAFGRAMALDTIVEQNRPKAQAS